MNTWSMSTCMHTLHAGILISITTTRCHTHQQRFSILARQHGDSKHAQVENCPHRHHLPTVLDMQHTLRPWQGSMPGSMPLHLQHCCHHATNTNVDHCWLLLLLTTRVCKLPFAATGACLAPLGPNARVIVLQPTKHAASWSCLGKNCHPALTPSHSEPYAHNSATTRPHEINSQYRRCITLDTPRAAAAIQNADTCHCASVHISHSVQTLHVPPSNSQHVAQQGALIYW